MTVDRQALRQRLERAAATARLDGLAIPREWLSQEELRSLLAGLEREEAANDEWEKLMGKVVAERDRLKDALSHAYADARALWAVTRGELETELAAEKDRRVQFQVALEHRVRAHERTQADRHKTRAECDRVRTALESVTSINGALQDEVAQLRAVLQVIINSAPDNEPERYDGESPALIRDNAMDSEAYWLAQVARRALESEEA